MNKKTNKTAHVLKLLAGSEVSTKENPILNNEFKDEMILNRRNSEKNQNGEKAITYAEQKDIKPERKNIVLELIEENLSTVLERFRCCDCEICK